MIERSAADCRVPGERAAEPAADADQRAGADADRVPRLLVVFVDHGGYHAVAGAALGDVHGGVVVGLSPVPGIGGRVQIEERMRRRMLTGQQSPTGRGSLPPGCW